ncbi:MAG: sensor histidine kinase [Bryobacteraceae bacterium]
MTERSNTVQELLQADEIREALVSSSLLPVIVLAATGEILLWNRAAERAFGWTAAEVLGGPLPFIPSERQEEHRAMRAQDLAGQGFTGREIRRKRKDGTWLDLSVSTAPLHDKAGAVTGILSIYVDITSRKQAETALKRQARELARSNADLQQFAHAVSHDLQEPLRAICSYAQLLERRCAPQDATSKEFLQFIVDGSQRMSALIRDLLAYSRVMEGENGFRDLVDLSAVVSDSMEDLSLMIQETGASVMMTGALPVVAGHRAALTQLVYNLLSNAIKYRKPDTPPQITIGAEHGEEEWIFKITDNGTGIDRRDYAKIFVIFQRLDPAKSSGTGLGLALCQKIVERHGGRIWVESEPGQGSTFYFTLPCRKNHGSCGPA